MSDLNGQAHPATDAPEPEPNSLETAFSPLEIHAFSLTAQLTEAMVQIIGDGPTRDADINELVMHIHPIQHMLMGQLAARCFPNQFRLLGQLIPAETAKRIGEEEPGA